MPLGAVFLDVGGTLLRENPSRHAIYAEAARRRGRDVDEAGMRSLMRRVHDLLPLEVGGGYRYSDPWFREFVRGIFHGELGLPERELAGLEDELFARFEDAATFRVFPGARELLGDLRARGVAVGVISNWSERLPRVLAAVGLDGLLDHVLCSATERMEKPDPALFRAAVERAGVAPEDALHAGDHLEKDVAGARRAGLEGVLVDHRDALEPPPGVVRVRSLPELRSRILERLVP